MVKQTQKKIKSTNTLKQRPQKATSSTSRSIKLEQNEQLKLNKYSLKEIRENIRNMKQG